MEMEFGYVKTYDINRGFGFLGRTFKENRQKRGDIWFHISEVKIHYPNIAKKLDSGSYSDIGLWYEFGKVNGKIKATKIWLTTSEIPQEKKDYLSEKVEEIWSESRQISRELLDHVTIELIGQSCRDKLVKKYNSRFKSPLERITESLNSQRLTSRKRKRGPRIENVISRPDRNNSSEVPSNVYVGLPEHLSHCILWVARRYRSNPLSHIPGGSDIVVEYHTGKALGYDWIKKPSAYIKTFFAGIIEYSSNAFEKLSEQNKIEITKRKISRVFARSYKSSDERSQALFVEVWNSETSDEMPYKSLEKFEADSINQIDLEDYYGLL
ncbi:MAG: hypothetical protein F6K16_37655 [Symploca sp. SIO2B6]|nr:hypothetical protein [Symploca sp. SIO2B6]